MSRKVGEAFVRVAVTAPRHPKWLRVPPAARWLLVAAICWSREKETDGELPRDAVVTLGVDKPWPLVDALVKAGLLDEIEGGYRIHDFGQWQETKQEIRDRRAEWKRRKDEERERKLSIASSR